MWASPVTRITGSAIATLRSEGYAIIPAVLDTRQLGAARAMVASLLAAEPPEPGHAGPYFLWLLAHNIGNHDGPARGEPRQTV